jgi:hypothetical protein
VKSATKPFSRRDEIILKQTGVYRSGSHQCGPGVRVSVMIEVAAVLMGLFSVGIFVAHAVDAYQAH